LQGEVGRLALAWKRLIASDESTSLLGRITEQLARITERPGRAAVAGAAATAAKDDTAGGSRSVDEAARPSRRSRKLSLGSQAASMTSCWCWRGPACPACTDMTQALSSLSLALTRVALVSADDDGYTGLAQAIKELDGSLKRLRVRVQVCPRLPPGTRPHTARLPGGAQVLRGAARGTPRRSPQGWSRSSACPRCGPSRRGGTGDRGVVVMTHVGLQHLTLLKQRCDKAGTVIRAELEHFHRLRLLDIRRAVLTFIEDQATHHARVRPYRTLGQNSTH
jgi:hypothetical protein